jgi:hypothetical protein
MSHKKETTREMRAILHGQTNAREWEEDQAVAGGQTAAGTDRTWARHGRQGVPSLPRLSL